jgi:alkylation response protein AidB-like acyl-CoA dehydrogenase
MRFDLAEQYQPLREMLRVLVEKEIAPYAEHVDRTGEYPRNQLEEMKKLKLTGYSIPKKYGGEEKSVTEQSIVIEEIARGCSSTAAVLSIYYLGSSPLTIAGTEEQKQKYLPALAAGNRAASFGLTEPGAGSDAASIKTSAYLDNDEYVLNGHKCFIGNCGESDIYFVFAKTDGNAGAKGISCFLVEKGTPGFRIGEIAEKMGLNGQRTGEFFLEDCRVPKENLIGELNKGFRIAMETLDNARIIVAASALGIAQSAYEEAMEFANNRIQFGQAIGNFQGILYKIADMATELQVAKLATYRASELADHKEAVSRHQFSSECAIAKYYATEVANKVVNESLQVLGGRGFIKGSKVERLYRDARVLKIYEGTSEIQKIVIGKSALSGKFVTEI